MKLKDIKPVDKKDDEPSILKKQAGFNKGDKQRYPSTQLRKKQAESVK